MSQTVSVLNKVDPNPYLDYSGVDQNWRRFEVAQAKEEYDRLSEKIRQSMLGLPCKHISLELHGTNYAVKVRIMKCCIWVRPIVWYRSHLLKYRHWAFKVDGMIESLRMENREEERRRLQRFKRARNLLVFLR